MEVMVQDRRHAFAMRDFMIVLYNRRLEEMRRKLPTVSAVSIDRMKQNAQVQLLETLIEELESMTFKEIG